MSNRTRESEVWRNIPSLPGYMVSSRGKIKTVPRRVRSRYGTRIVPEKLRKTFLCHGYEYLSTTNRTVRVHRLVAEAFLENRDNLPQVNHINGVRNDNRVENLEWCDASQNRVHAIEKLGAKTRTTKEMLQERSEMLDAFDNGATYNDLSARFKKPRSQIGSFLSRARADRKKLFGENGREG
jgi:hypothetical protein